MGWSALAVVVALLAVGLELWAVALLGWRRACDVSAVPPDPALSLLVFGGPFRLIRHPQMLGLLLLGAAAALQWRTPAMWLLALLVAVVVVAMARRDDRECAARFGEAYARYRRAVPFLLPTFSRTDRDAP